MKVKMLVSMAGPDESWKPGDVREVPEAVAKEWQGLGMATILPAGPAVVEAKVEAVPAPKAAPTKRCMKAKK